MVSSSSKSEVLVSIVDGEFRDDIWIWSRIWRAGMSRTLKVRERQNNGWRAEKWDWESRKVRFFLYVGHFVGIFVVVKLCGWYLIVTRQRAAASSSVNGLFSWGLIKKHTKVHSKLPFTCSLKSCLNQIWGHSLAARILNFET